MCIIIQHTQLLNCGKIYIVLKFAILTILKYIVLQHQVHSHRCSTNFQTAEMNRFHLAKLKLSSLKTTPHHPCEAHSTLSLGN